MTLIPTMKIYMSRINPFSEAFSLLIPRLRHPSLLWWTRYGWRIFFRIISENNEKDKNIALSVLCDSLFIMCKVHEIKNEMEIKIIQHLIRTGNETVQLWGGSVWFNFNKQIIYKKISVLFTLRGLLYCFYQEKLLKHEEWKWTLKKKLQLHRQLHKLN